MSGVPPCGGREAIFDRAAYGRHKGTTAIAHVSPWIPGRRSVEKEQKGAASIEADVMDRTPSRNSSER